MAKLNLTVNDDAGQIVSTNVVNLTNTTYLMGVTASQYDLVGFRFISVTVPQAGTVRRAVIRVNMASIASTTKAVSIAAQAADNAAAFTTTGDDLGARTLTTAEAAALSRIDDMPDGYYEFDVTASVQAVINRAGWSSGNAVVIMFSTTDSSLLTISTKENANDDPQLEIVYDDSATTELVVTDQESVNVDWTNITNIEADDGVEAQGNNMSTTETFVAKTFGITGPSGSDTIEDITIKIEWRSSANGSKERIGVELSWDGGTSWSTKKYTQKSALSLEYHYVSGGPSGWGHTFTPSELSNTNFKVRISPDSGASTTEYFIDVVTAQVYYTVTTSAAITGTITPTATEADIVTGGKTLIITLTGDTWIAAGALSFDLQRDEIIAGVDSAQSEATGWDLVPKATQSLGGVVRTSDTVVTITWDAFATYNITATETITVTVPGTALTGGSPLVATPTFTVTATASGVTPTRMLMGLGT